MEQMEQMIKEAENRVRAQFADLEATEYFNSGKVLAAFQKHNINEAHFAPTTGYGYDDLGRDTLEQIYAEIFGGEDAIVRHTITSGTHALSMVLFGLLLPGDHLLAVTGKPYDTLEEAIGIRGNAHGSLREMGVSYKQVELLDSGLPDYDGIARAIAEQPPKVVMMQRSKGYSFRKSLDMQEMQKLIAFIKQRTDAYVFVDNCYGEFVEKTEPIEAGADVIAGSLIKNPGGGLAPTGGYIVGSKDAIERIAGRLTCPGIGKEGGASLGVTKSFYQGLFLAPSVVCAALKTAVLAASVFESLGYAVCPAPDEKRTDIIQAVRLENEARLIAFCQGIQMGAPIDSAVLPEPWDMPGYAHKVIMAAGAFVQGSSIELSADAPIKPPFIAYLQGGLTYSYGKRGLICALSHLQQKNLLYR